jgi:Tfp pilus assembly PilM family ATPase
VFTKKITTLSIDGNDLRCLVLRRDEVLSWRTATAPETLVNQGIIHDPQAAAELLQKLIKNIKGGKRNFLSSVTDQRLVHRIMNIPAVKENLREETVQRKAKQEFAIPVDESDFSWKIIRQDANQLFLLVLAIPKLVIDQQVAMLKAAGIKPKRLDAKPLALIRCVDRPTAVVVNLEPHSMSVIIVINRIPVIVRTIPLEGEDFSREARLDLLAQELGRTTKYYNESNKKNRLPDDTPLFITGKLFTPPDMDQRLEGSVSLSERLQTTTSFPVQLPGPPLKYPENFPVAEYAVNLGAALLL